MKNKILVIALVSSFFLHSILLGGWGAFFRAVPQKLQYIEFLLMNYKKVAAFDDVTLPSTRSEPQAAKPSSGGEAAIPAAALPKPKIEVSPVKETVSSKKKETAAAGEITWTEISESKIGTANVVISYKKLLQEMIIQHLEYPKDEKARGVTGTVVVSFVVLNDGRLKEVDIPAQYRSPVESFNRASVEAVKKASEFFPPFPTTCREKEIRFIVRIHFD